MVVAAELVTALVIAGTLSYLFAHNLKRRGNRSGFFWFFLLIFMITWAGGLWLMPFGPALLGIHWLPFATIGLVGAIVVSLLAGRRYPRNRHETIDLLERVEKGRELQKVTYLSLNIFFWLVLLVLVMAVVFRYVLR
jgi:MFS family permease